SVPVLLPGACLGCFGQVFDISSGAGTAIPVQFPSDFDKLREHWVKNPMDYLTSVHIPNDGGSVC
ncbi:MAG: peptidase, partial [Bryobacterales bacterium]|nr:peptidase [Bryobacterales bacterium]